MSWSSVLSLLISLALWAIAFIVISVGIVKFKRIPRFLLIILGYIFIFFGGLAMFHFLFNI